MRFYHGTDYRDAVSLTEGAALSTAIAEARKIDGPPGFFLAGDEGEAEHFASRRSDPAVIVVDVEEVALTALISAGAVRQRITVTDRSPFFVGEEVIVPPQAFALYNALVAEGRIRYV